MYSVSVANALKEEETQICGVVVIHNMSDLGWRHLRNVDKKTFKVMLGILQVCELFCLVIMKLTITKLVICIYSAQNNAKKLKYKAYENNIRKH